MDVIQALAYGKRVSDFVEGGQLAAAMADAGLQAGVDALKTLPMVNDKQAQVWSAVNHLQFAEGAVRQSITTRTSLKQHARRLAMGALVDRREYVLCLLAVCYRYLGEPTLFEQAMRQARTAREVLDMSEARLTATGLLNMANPVTWVDLFRPSPCRVNVDVFEDRIRSLPGPESSVEMPDDPVCACGHRQTNHWPEDTSETSCNAIYASGSPYDTSDATSGGGDLVYCECPRFSVRQSRG